MTYSKDSTVANGSLALENLVLSFARRGTAAQPSPTRPDVLLVPRYGDFRIEELWEKLEELDISDGWKIWNLTQEAPCITASVLEREQLAEVKSHLESGFLICLTEVFYTEDQALDSLTEALGPIKIKDLRIEDGIFALLNGALVKLA